jgi:hypothetical protein
MFSDADYELAARVLGLPVPRTPAERAAATPMVATVLRNYYRAAPPMPGREGAGIMTQPTRSLNSYPDTSQPEIKVQLERRLQAGLPDQEAFDEVEELVAAIMRDPSLLDVFLQYVENSMQQGDEGAEYLSRQRPAEYDMPNYGGQYSMLNAPSSNNIPPSVAFQALG